MVAASKNVQFSWELQARLDALNAIPSQSLFSKVAHAFEKQMLPHQIEAARIDCDPLYKYSPVKFIGGFSILCAAFVAIVDSSVRFSTHYQSKFMQRADPIKRVALLVSLILGWSCWGYGHCFAPLREKYMRGTYVDIWLQQRAIADKLKSSTSKSVIVACAQFILFLLSWGRLYPTNLIVLRAKDSVLRKILTGSTDKISPLMWDFSHSFKAISVVSLLAIYLMETTWPASFVAKAKGFAFARVLKGLEHFDRIVWGRENTLELMINPKGVEHFDRIVWGREKTLEVMINRIISGVSFGFTSSLDGVSRLASFGQTHSVAIAIITGAWILRDVPRQVVAWSYSRVYRFNEQFLEGVKKSLGISQREYWLKKLVHEVQQLRTEYPELAHSDLAKMTPTDLEGALKISPLKIVAIKIKDRVLCKELLSRLVQAGAELCLEDNNGRPFGSYESAMRQLSEVPGYVRQQESEIEKEADGDSPEFLCPISYQSVGTFPVLDPTTGTVYSERGIKEWLNAYRHGSPVSREPLSERDLILLPLLQRYYASL